MIRVVGDLNAAVSITRNTAGIDVGAVDAVQLVRADRSDSGCPDDGIVGAVPDLAVEGACFRSINRIEDGVA